MFPFFHKLSFLQIFLNHLGDGIAHYHSRFYLLVPVVLACGLYVGILIPVDMWWSLVMIMVALLGWSVAPYVFDGMGGYAIRAVFLMMFASGWVNGWIASHFHYQMPYGGVVAIQGTVADIIYKNGKIRYLMTDTHAIRLKDKGRVIDNTVLESMVPIPDVRLGGIDHGGFTPDIGDKIMGKGVLLSHFAPDFVGGFSMQRYLLERGMMGYVNVTKKYAPSWSVIDGYLVHELGGDGGGISMIKTGIAHIRHSIVQNIQNVDYGGEPQGTVGPLKSIAIALMVGKRDFMVEDDNKAIRDSGLAHVMAISGMHVGLLIAMVFFIMRRFLGCIPSIALRYDTKILAVLIALPMAIFYVLISGMGIPALRALGMAGLALLGVLMYRNAITVRIVVVIACVMMLFNPLWFMQVGFLLSFSAVLALVVFAEFYSQYLRNLGDKKPFYSKGILGYGFGVLCASGIATIATLPTVVQYFGVFPLYGIVANMIVVPLVSLWVMPMGLLSGIVMAFGALGGLEDMILSWVLGGMLAGIEVMMDTAYAVQALPHAVVHLQALPTVYYAILMGAGIVACLLISHKRTNAGVPHKVMDTIMVGGTQFKPQQKIRNILLSLMLLVFIGGVFVAQLSPLPVVMVNKTATTYGVRSPYSGTHGGVVIAGWTKTMYRDSIVASVAQHYAIPPDSIGHQKCDRKAVCSIAITVPVGDGILRRLYPSISGTLLETILKPPTQVKNLLIVPHKMTAQQITALCEMPENGIILAPKSHVDYGNCNIPVLGKADFANMGSVTVFWAQDGIKLLDDTRDLVVKRQGSNPLPYLSQK